MYIYICRYIYMYMYMYVCVWDSPIELLCKSDHGVSLIRTESETPVGWSTKKGPFPSTNWLYPHIVGFIPINMYIYISPLYSHSIPVIFPLWSWFSPLWLYHHKPQLLLPCHNSCSIPRYSHHVWEVHFQISPLA